MDVGYTVLVIPRSAVSKISKADDVSSLKPAAGASLLSTIAPQFYSANAFASPARDVSDLVKQIGEALSLIHILRDGDLQRRGGAAPQ